MSTFQLTLNPERYESLTPWKPVVVKFNTQEELTSYLDGEYKFCEKEYRDYARAWLVSDRQAAFEKLVAKRKQYLDVRTKAIAEVEKDVA